MSDIAVVGSEEFVKRLESAGKPAEAAQPIDGTQTLEVTVDEHGQIHGDTSHIPPEILAQLQTPEAAEMMGKQYREFHGGKVKTGRREIKAQMPQPRTVTPVGKTRDLRHLAPPGMNRRDRRKLKHLAFKQFNKAAIAQGRA